MPLATLNADDVVRIHYALVEEFASSDNPIDPPGVKSQSLLESAVGRQHTSLGNTIKYPDPYSNAATLAYGICCDHAFHNGNKRTSLVSLLVHLYKNRLSLAGVKERDLYNLVLAIAKHEVYRPSKARSRIPGRPATEDEIAGIADWIKDSAIPVKRGEYILTYRELRKILRHFGYELETPKGNSIDIVQVETRRDLLRRERVVRTRIANIDYPGEGETVAVRHLKYIRRRLKLSAEDGVDSDTFYGLGEPIDSFIVEHRGILYKLASK